MVAAVSDESVCDVPMTQQQLDDCRSIYPMMTVTQCQEFTWNECQTNQCLAECLAPCDDNDWACRDPCHTQTCNPCEAMCEARCAEVTGDSIWTCIMGCDIICHDFNSDHTGESVFILANWQMIIICF